MVKGILPDANAIGQIDALVRQMQVAPWAEFWNGLGLQLRHFADFGLSLAATDAEIWHVCQAEQLILITDNRNWLPRTPLKLPFDCTTNPIACPYLQLATLQDSRIAERMLTRF